MKVIQESLIGAEAISLTAKYYVTLNEVSSSEYDVERMQWMKFVELTLMLMGFPEKLRKSVIPVSVFSVLNYVVFFAINCI